MNANKLRRATSLVCSELGRLGDDLQDIAGITARDSYSWETKRESILVQVQARTPEHADTIGRLFGLTGVRDEPGGNYYVSGDWTLMGIHLVVFTGSKTPRQADPESADCYAAELS